MNDQPERRIDMANQLREVNARLAGLEDYKTQAEALKNQLKGALRLAAILGTGIMLFAGFIAWLLSQLKDLIR